MSVLKNKRTTSKAEFVNTANEIYTETINFLSRLSARYSRLLADPTAKLAAEVVDNAEKAQSFFTSDDMRLDLRKQHLLLARGALMALDVQLCHCYMVMMKNPQGCFTDAKGNKVPKKQAEEQLQGHIAYYKNFDDHGRVKHLRRIIHATFRGGENHV